MKDLLKGFGANFGDEASPPEPTTLGGLIDFARGLHGEVATANLMRYAADLAQRCRQAARDTEQDLLDELDPTFMKVLRSLSDCFLEAQVELDSLQESVTRAENFDDNLETLAVLQGEIVQLSRCLQGWTSSREPLCARCGSKGPEESCSRCDLERLVPDSQADPEIRSAHLGPQYVQLYKTYRDIVNGEAPLRVLPSALVPLEKELQQVRRLSRHGPDSIQPLAEQGIQGLARMREALASRHVRDLNEGWSQVFRAATALATHLPGLLRELGHNAEASELERNARFQEDIRLGE
jgi:hypothetical protein